MRLSSICRFDISLRGDDFWWGAWFSIGEFELLRADLHSIIEIVTEYTMVLQCIILLCRPLSCTEQRGYRYSCIYSKRGYVCCAMYFPQECGDCGGVLEFGQNIEWSARETTTVESVVPRELLGHRRVFVAPSESS